MPPKKTSEACPMMPRIRLDRFVATAQSSRIQHSVETTAF